MPASEAQVRANQANAAKSTGPKTAEGKERSRANSFKHGLTGSGIVTPEREAAEVRRRFASFAAELNPSGEVGLALVLHAARMSVRMERCADHENAMQTERVRRALAEYELPEGLDEAGLAKLRAEVSDRAVFGPSHEATLARKYEAAAERSFFRALKELRAVERHAKAVEAERVEGESASFSPAEMTDEEFDRMCAEVGPLASRKPADRVEPADFAALRGRIDVPIAIGKRR